MDEQPLDDLREAIDVLDKQLVALLNERARAALQIGKVKAGAGKEPYDPVRERTVLDKIDALNEGPLPKGSLEEIYAAIMTACRELQIQKSS